MTPLARGQYIRRNLQASTLARQSGLNLGAPYAPYSRAGSLVRWVEDYESIGLRFVGFQDDIRTRTRETHTGWYERSEDYDSVIRGAVFQLPSRRGQMLFVPGYVRSDDAQRGNKTNGRRSESWTFDAACVAFSDIEREATKHAGGTPNNAGYCDSAIECARRADRIAELVAEESREYDEAWQAGQQFESLGEEIATAWQSLKGLARERADWRKRIRAFTLTVKEGAICDAINDKAAALWEAIEGARKKRAELESTFGRYRAEAWNDGRGCFESAPLPDDIA